MKEKVVYLIRHGEISISGEKTYIGVLDIPLSSSGILQAQTLKTYFNKISIDKIYCSDLKRSIDTAAIIGENKALPITKLSGLREINMGEWEGKTFKEIKEKYPEQFENRIKDIENFTPPQGESFKACQERAVNIFNTIIKGDGNNVVVVAHAGINRVILATLLGIPLSHIFKFKQGYGCMNKIIFNEFNYVVEYINYIL